MKYNSEIMQIQTKKWDVFISHAVEDQAGFVRNLAAMLNRLGLKVWYAETALQVGQSLTRSIDQGLAGSDFGIVVLSPHFFAKKWPEYELRGLIYRENYGGKSIVLPVWHGVTREQVEAYSPALADKVGLNTAIQDATEIALSLLQVIRRDLYEQTDRSQLLRLADPLQELQEQIQHTRRELEEANSQVAHYKSEFTCPFCEAPLSRRDQAPMDPDEKHWDTVESFECGYMVFGGDVKSLCPSDPKFPNLEDFELVFQEIKGEPHSRWTCVAIPKTDMARMLHGLQGQGKTKEEAEYVVKRAYERASKHF